MCCELRVSNKGVLSRSRYEGRDALGGEAHLRRGRGIPRAARRPAHRRYSRCASACSRCTASTRALTMARSGRGALELDTPELKLKFRSNQQSRDRRAAAQRRASADRGMPDHRQRRRGTLPRPTSMPEHYRVHGLPELDRLRRCDSSCASSVSGCRQGQRTVRPEHLRELLYRRIGDRPDTTLISTAVVRHAAGRLPGPGQHRAFRAGAGLGSARSPRRIGAIRISWYTGGSARCCAQESPADLLTWHGPFAALGQDCSFRERRADEATRSAVSWLSASTSREHIGREFDGIVSGVVDFGLSCSSGPYR